MLNVTMNQLGTVYATKRRRRNGKSIKPPPKDGVVKSNPSKRHRERLNAELDTLASLLPFEQNIISKLDRLSILRLAVAYLRTKSYFQASMIREKEEIGGDYRPSRGDLVTALTAYDHTILDGELFLQALNGFLLMISCEDGEFFFATHNIECYLGMHQSDIVHQSIWDMVHSEDREELQRQLMWNAFLPSELSGMSLQETFSSPEHVNYLERSFTVRFRCLLDNTSGFLRLDIRGRVKVLHGQNRKTEEPPLGLFALCTPFGPPTLLEAPQKEFTIKSKHKLDLGTLSMDQRGKMLIGYSDAELTNMGGYDLVHFDDLAYVASAHQELLKTGQSHLHAYRLQSKDGNWKWLQTTSKLIYKNSKPDFIVCCHRPLMEEEGRDLLGKRTMDFKVSYLDAGLTYFTEQDTSAPLTATLPTSQSSPAQPKARRYKTQLRDFLATCRSKRKLATSVPGGSNSGDYSSPSSLDGNIGSGVSPSATSIQHIQQAAVAAASYPTPYNCGVYGGTGYGSTDTNHLYVQQQNFYHHPANFDNRYLDSTSLFQYRALGTYYPEYSSAYVGNGFLDVSRGCLYENQYTTSSSSSNGKDVCSDYKNAVVHGSYAATTLAGQQSLDLPKSHHHHHSHQKTNGLIESSTPKSESIVDIKREEYMMHYSNGIGGNGGSESGTPRQTVLMWGPSTGTTPSTAPLSRHTSSVITPQSMYDRKYCSAGSTSDPLRSLSEMNSSAAIVTSSTASQGEHKWGVGSIIKNSLGVVSDSSTNSAHHHLPHLDHSSGSTSSSVVLENSALAAAKYLQYHHPQTVGMGMTGAGTMGGEQGSASEVWVYPPPTHHSLVADTYYPTGTNRTEVLCCPSLR